MGTLSLSSPRSDSATPDTQSHPQLLNTEVIDLSVRRPNSAIICQMLAYLSELPCPVNPTPAGLSAFLDSPHVWTQYTLRYRDTTTAPHSIKCVYPEWLFQAWAQWKRPLWQTRDGCYWSHTFQCRLEDPFLPADVWMVIISSLFHVADTVFIFMYYVFNRTFPNDRITIRK